MQLHSARAGGETPLELADGVVVWIEATEGHQPTVRRGRGGEHRVVRLSVTGLLHQREHDPSRVGQGQRVDQLIR